MTSQHVQGGNDHEKVLKIIAIILAVVLVIAIGYVAYVFISYHRLPDSDEALAPTGERAKAGESYTIATWNLGFGAYSDDFGFFMDGGTESWAFSKDAVYANLGFAQNQLKELDPDLMILQELDTDATRSYHVNQVDVITEALPDYQSFFAQNYARPSCSIPSLSPTAPARRAS